MNHRTAWFVRGLSAVATRLLMNSGQRKPKWSNDSCGAAMVRFFLAGHTLMAVEISIRVVR